jgi:hypothetical protein
MKDNVGKHAVNMLCFYLRGKGVVLYRTPGPDPIEINVASFLVGICNFVIQSGMSFEYVCVFTRVVVVTQSSTTTSSFGLKAAGRTIVSPHVWEPSSRN